MSNYDQYKQTLSSQQLQSFQARITADRQQYSKITQLLKAVNEDPTSRLPYLPIFYRTRKVEDQLSFLTTVVPKVYQARGQQYCQDTCNNQGPSCLNQCKEFASKAFALGNSVFASLHKPYTYSSFVQSEEQ